MLCYIIKIALRDSWGASVMTTIRNVKIIHGDKLSPAIACTSLYVDDFKQHIMREDNWKRVVNMNKPEGMNHVAKQSSDPIQQKYLV